MNATIEAGIRALEAYGNPRAVICWQGGAQCGYWETFVADSEITADTEAEALVAALECAP